jgi:flagellar biosynthetic protein FliQ
MTETVVLEIGRETMFVILKLSGPLLAAGMIVGVAIALVQSLTTIQEMTLTFVPKIIATFVALVFMLPLMMQVMIDFTRQLFDLIVTGG